MDYLRCVFSECRAKNQLINGHNDNLVEFYDLLRGVTDHDRAQQQRHDEVQVVIEDLHVEF
jgi:hypothetical protein